MILGSPSKRLLPPFPELSPIGHIANYLEVHQATPVPLAQRQLQFLESTKSGATIMGTLRKHYWGPEVNLAGIRVTVSSGTQVVEAITRDDGTFVASGLRAGRLDVRPALGDDMTVINRKEQNVFVPEGGCATVTLTLGLNGRVRGRIVGSPNVPLDTVTLGLNGIGRDRHLPDPETPQVGARPQPDGTFEFSGVPAGTFLLRATVDTTVNGTSRTVTTYFPGTHDRDAAVPIVVGKATQHDGLDFVIQTE